MYKNWKKSEDLVLLRRPSPILDCIHSTYCLARDRMRLNAIPRPEPGPRPNTASGGISFLLANDTIQRERSAVLTRTYTSDTPETFDPFATWHHLDSPLIPENPQDMALLRTHTLCLYSRTERNFPESWILQQINLEFPWRRARHGLASLKMLMEAE